MEKKETQLSHCQSKKLFPIAQTGPVAYKHESLVDR